MPVDPLTVSLTLGVARLFAGLLQGGLLAQQRAAENRHAAEIVAEIAARDRRARFGSDLIGGLISGAVSYHDSAAARRLATIREDRELKRIDAEHGFDLELLYERFEHERILAADRRLHDERMLELRASLEEERRRQDRGLKNSPFEDLVDVVHDQVLEASAERSRPVLIPTPLYAPATGPPGAGAAPDLRTLVRRSWYQAPWQDTMTVLSGLIMRPLERIDLDVQTIHRALRDLPVVLVHGQLHAASEVRLEVNAWGLSPHIGTNMLHLRLPPMSLDPADPAASRDAQRLARDLEDTVGEITSLAAGICSEWFHVVRGGTPPRLHREVPDEAAALREALALNASLLLGAHDDADPVGQSVVLLSRLAILAESGLTDLSRSVLPHAADAARASLAAEHRRYSRLADALSEAYAAVKRNGDPALIALVRQHLGGIRDDLRRKSLEKIGIER
jgi:hypothetical protein